MRQGEIWVNNSLAGILTEGDNDYSFEYNKTYLEKENAKLV
jgi:serine/threonine-protein kinase HipA